jgi:hypothetical protein
MTTEGTIASIYSLISKKKSPIVIPKSTHTTIKTPEKGKPAVRGFVQLSFYVGSAP